MCGFGPDGSWGWGGWALNLVCNSRASLDALWISNDKECLLHGGHCQRHFASLSEAQNQSFLLPPQTHTFGPGIDWKTWKSMGGCLDANINIGMCPHEARLTFWELQFFGLFVFQREWKFVLFFWYKLNSPSIYICTDTHTSMHTYMHACTHALTRGLWPSTYSHF